MNAFACLLATAAAGCSIAHPSVASAPSTRQPVVEGRLYAVRGPGFHATDSLFGVRVTVHGRSLLLAVDHGAEATLLTDSALRSVHIVPRLADVTRKEVVVRKQPGEALVPDSTASAVLVRGDSLYEYWGPTHDVRIDTLRIGTAVETNIVQILDEPDGDVGEFDGLIGRDIPSQFDLEFDVPHGSFRLYAPDSLWLPPGLSAGDCVASPATHQLPIDTVSLTHADSLDVGKAIGWALWNERVLKIPITVGNQQLSAEFDSGIDETIINWAEAKQFGISRDSPSLRAVVAPWGRFGAPDTTFLADAPQVRVGGRRLAAVPVRISDFKFDAQTSTLDVPQILLGWKQFRGRVLFLSYSRGVVCVSPD